MFLKGLWKFLFISAFLLNTDAQLFPPPEIQNCPANILHAIAYNETSVDVTWQEPVSTNTQVVTTHTPGSSFNVGKELVRYTFTSMSNGEIATCDFTVEVKRIDTIPPEVEQCPRRVSAPISPMESTVSVTWTEPSATDNTGSDVVVTKTHSPGDRFVRGFTEVNYTFADTSGNVNSCSFAVTVYLVDDIPPTVKNCPSNISMNVPNHMVFEAVSWMEPSATDETSPNDSLEVYRSHSPGDRFRAGVTNVLYVFADESQNVVSCTFQINLDPPDFPKVSSCPRSRVEFVKDDDPEPTMLYQQNPQFLTGDSAAVLPPDVGAQNQTFVQIQISPPFNEIICSYDVYVFKVDTIAPVINDCDRTEIRTAKLGLKGWREEISIPELNFTTSVSAGTNGKYFFPVGETVLAVLVQDDAKNARVCSVSVVVKPAINGCPMRISGESKTDGNALQVYWPIPTVPGVVPTTDPTSGTVFMLGSTQVQHTFMNGTDMIELCEFEVIVEEENPLTIMSCPDDIVETLPTDSDSVIVTWVIPNAVNKLGSDHPVRGVSATHNSGDSFTVGETTIVYVFQDESKPRFRINCTFVVAVRDTTEPVFTRCPAAVRLSVLAWYGTFEWEKEIIPMDNSGEIQIFASHVSSFRYPLGETPVNLTVVDSSGNFATCSFPVIVSLILPLPVLILIGAAILLAVILFTVCCCCCCTKNGKRDGNVTESHNTDGPSVGSSNPGYYNQQAQGDKRSKDISDSPRKQGNNYESEMQMNYIKPQEATFPTNKAGEYAYVDETPPPVPTTPRPVNSHVAYVNDSVDKFPTNSPTNAAEPLKIPDEQGYLTPSDNLSLPHQYVYVDNHNNPKEYSYAYDHTQ